jgi:hypothetical protein
VTWRVEHGDCLDVMRGMADASVDAVVTDPPYGLSFMGKHWDHGVPGVDFWREALRVAKPGAHLLAFGGTRTFHRLVVAIEDAGWEIRDQIAWLYGSGFPKSHNVSKAIDRAAGAEREVVGPNPNSRPNMVRVQASVLAPRVDAPLTAPATDAARQWDGWGTALKPAMEPVCVARKPLVGTVAANVLKHGTGALNINGCRVGTTKDVPASLPSARKSGSMSGAMPAGREGDDGHNPNVGRWPANVIHDGSDEVVAGFPSSESRPGATKIRGESRNVYGVATRTDGPSHGDTGSAARFFYQPKASKAERLAADDGTNHPTQKPVALMAYLCRLVTPPNGIVLDPFTGSGTTGVAAIREGFRFVGIEREAQYVEIARQRITDAAAQLALPLGVAS